jgi:adenine-specific DNA-methyltransferase
LSEYEILRSRIGKERADSAVAMGWIAPPDDYSAFQLPVVLPKSHNSPKDLAKPVKGQRYSKAAEFGQFMTPAGIAEFMAGLFRHVPDCPVRLLDAGAGQGALTLAFLNRWSERDASTRIVSTCYEVDSEMSCLLERALTKAHSKFGIEFELICDDFIKQASQMIQLGKGPRFTHAILNPPYKKINSSSDHRAYLRDVGLETVNLYSAFVGLSIALMEKGGEIVAIIPRSFCNGPYYQSFRKFMIARAALQHIHLFDTRNTAFKSDGVLQENVILRLVRGEKQGAVTISTSTDATFSDYQETEHDFKSIVFPSDHEQFIHIPTSDETQLLQDPAFQYRLDEVGLSVSTGPVVDFRMVGDLLAQPNENSFPLLYPGHFGPNGLDWPKANFKKPNAIRNSTTTKKWLFPSGYYTVVRRFSSKEERRRIVASIVDPNILQAEMFGFENHLNVLHDRKRPLSEDIARGIAVFLNSSFVDRSFRRFNGHTQVNATDLRNMRYPSRDALINLGTWSKKSPNSTQSEIDTKVAEIA